MDPIAKYPNLDKFTTPQLLEFIMRTTDVLYKVTNDRDLREAVLNLDLFLEDADVNWQQVNNFLSCHKRYFPVWKDLSFDERIIDLTRRCIKYAMSQKCDKCTFVCCYAMEVVKEERLREKHVNLVEPKIDEIYSKLEGELT